MQRATENERDVSDLKPFGGVRACAFSINAVARVNAGSYAPSSNTFVAVTCDRVIFTLNLSIDSQNDFNESA